MLKPEDVEFPSEYFECYESVLMTILKCMGLVDEASVMGTQAYFVLYPDTPSVVPRFNRVQEEWQRVFGLEVKVSPIFNKGDLKDAIATNLDAGMPICLPVDIYLLSHTPHYNRLHQHHYVGLFGHDDGRYYMICPYYRFRGWVDKDLVYRGFFAPVVEKHRQISTVPKLELAPLSAERACVLVRESCEYMLGLATPEALTDMESQCLGLAGIRTCAGLARRLLIDQNMVPRNNLLLLSSQFKEIGYSRYWFHKFLQTFQRSLLPANGVDDLLNRFETIVKSWKTIGTMLGAGVHGNNPRLMQRAVLEIEKVHEQENQLFYNLLEALPD
jgi:hypothetical protein